MAGQADPTGGPRDETVSLAQILTEISHESRRLAEQCVAIQWTISALLDSVDHPDLGAEIHMLQDIDRIQQTLADIASVLSMAGDQAPGAPIEKGMIGSAIRLESLRQRLGISESLPDPTPQTGASDITWL